MASWLPTEAAIYDEVMTEHVVELKHNVAYEKHKPVRMTRNICYTSPRYQMPQEEDGNSPFLTHAFQCRAHVFCSCFYSSYL